MIGSCSIKVDQERKFTNGFLEIHPDQVPIMISNMTGYYESRGTLATQNINYKICVRRFGDLRKTIARNNRLDK